ncbi:MAG: YhdP family protein [Limnohabitans sp.]
MLSLPPSPRLSLWLHRCVHGLSWGLLVLGLLLGLAWGVLHLWIVPRIADYRPALERLAQQSMGVPVRIGEISAQSTGWVPSLELRRIELLDRQGRPALSLPRVVIAISVRSVLRLSLEQLVLDGPELDIRLTASGQWQIAGLDWPKNRQGDSAGADWLFSQNEVLIRHGTLRWTHEPALVPLKALSRPGQPHSAEPALPPPPAQTLALRDVDLILRNSVRHHDLRLDATPPEGWGERFVSMGRFKRGLLSTHAGQFSDWSGQAYAYFPQVDVSQLGQHLPLGADIRSGQGALRVWSDFEKGQWTGGAADTDLTDLNVRFDPQYAPLAFERLSGRLATQVRPTGFEVSTRQLAFVSAEGLRWPGGNLTLAYTHEQSPTRQPAQGRLQADHLDLEALRDLALRLPLPAELHQHLQSQQVSGQVQTLQLSWQGPWQKPPSYDVQAQVDQLNLPARASADGQSTAPGWPGVQGAQIQLKMNQSGGQIQLDMGHDGAVFLPGILDEPSVPVDSLRAQARWQRKDGRWDVPQWSLQLSNPDLQGQWQGQWHASAKDAGPGVLDLQGQVSRAQANRVHRYLPTVLPATVRQYVRDAIVKGTYSGVQIHIQGDIARMPFAHPQEGVFRFAGRLNDVELDYVPAALWSQHSAAWPRLHDLSGLLVFDRLGMKLSDAKARVADAKTGLQLNALQAHIPNMNEQAVLEVSAEGKGPATQVLALVQKSPLDKLLGLALHDTQATGNLQTRVKLNIPLLRAQDSKVQGTVVMGGNNLHITPGVPTLEKVQGSIQFSESGFGLSGVQARWLGGPVRVEGGMKPAAANEPTLVLRAQGEVSAEGLRQTPELASLDLLTPQLSGSTAYTASLGWRQGQPELSIQSQLEGLAMKLPAPLGKAAPVSLPLSIRSRVQGQGSGLQDHIQIDLGRVASVQYVRDLSGLTPRVLRGSMALGNNHLLPPMPDAGVSAMAWLDQFSVDDWQALWPTPAHSEVSASDHALLQSYLPTRIALQANTLTADGRTLHEVVAGGSRENLTWRANVDARELSGHLQFRQPSGDQPGQLYARLARLNLPPSTVADVESLLAAPPANLPALDIVIEQLELRGKQLGRIEIEAVNSELQKSRAKPTREWQLNKFNIVLPEATLRSTGRWLTANEGSSMRKTEMRFHLSIDDAGALLTRLGTPGALRGGSGLLEGDIRWNGSPLGLHYPSMDGQFDVKMGRGQFLKADAGAAKLLGVLSLQALPRRLLLDFRDVFYEGFAFDSVVGHVNIDHGTASTRNLQIKGVNAVVQLEGSADIAKETQQLRVVILPELDTGTASLVAGIAVNPLVGLTTFLAQLYLQSPLARASAQEFMIDGSWTAPRVTRVDNTARPPASAAPTQRQ